MSKNEEINYRDLEQQIFEALNQIRTKPRSFIPILENEIKNFEEQNVLIRPNQKPIQTEEGVSAYEEAIEFLNNQNKLSPLILDKRLVYPGYDLIKDLKESGNVQHEDSNGNLVNERVENYVEWDKLLSENIELGGKTGEEVIIDLLVDDGIKERLNRKNLFNKDNKYIGIACGSIKKFDNINILIYVGNLRDKGSLSFDYENYKYDYNSNDNNEKRKIVNEYQYNDPDAPDNTIGLKIFKQIKNYKNKKIIVTKKCYFLDDGTEHIVELEEF